MIRKRPGSLYLRLVAIFMLAMCVLFIALRVIYAQTVKVTRETVSRRAEESLLRITEGIYSDILLLKRVEPQWLLDQQTLSGIAGERERTPILHYSLYSQLQRRLSLFVGNANINGMYLYFTRDGYLLPVMANNALSGALPGVLADYRASERRQLRWIDGNLCIFNAYTGIAQTYQDDAKYLLAFSLSLDTLFREMASDEILWIAEPDGTVHASNGAAQDAKACMAQIDAGAQAVTWDGREYAALTTQIEDGVARVYYLTRIELNAIHAMSRGFSLALLACCLLVCATFWLSVSRLIRRPLKALAGAFREMETDGSWPQIERASTRDMAEIADSFNHMVMVQRYLVEQRRKNEMMARQAELKLLQAQINPHFLYNSFFLMNNLLQLRDYEAVENLTENLGLYFRYIFMNADGMKPLKDEVGHAVAYANIQRMRFMDRISIHVESVPAEWENEPIPAIVIQPLLENAFLHGFGKQEEPGELRLAFAASAPHRLTIRVSNTGTPVAPGQLEALRARLNAGGAPDSALINIHRRLCLVYGGGLRISSPHGRGFAVEFTIVRREEPPCSIE